MSTPRTPQAGEEKTRQTPHEEEPGRNAVQHQPDPTAEPTPDGEHKFVPRSPYTTGNY